MRQSRFDRGAAYHRGWRAGRAVALAAALAILAACGGGGSSGQTPAPPPPPPPPPPVTGPLTGPGTALARDAITTIDAGDTYTAAEISVGPNGEEIMRTKLEIVFRPMATVAEVNDLLNDIDAEITTSIAGLESVVVRIPDPGTLAALDTVVVDIETRPYVWFVSRSVLAATKELPANIPPAEEKAIAIRHHLAVGAAGAWNARAAATTAPRVWIQDYFGDGPPDAALNYVYDGNAASDFVTGKPHDHGYHVAGIVGGAFGGPDSLRGYVTGMLPRTMRLFVMDEVGKDPLDMKLRLLQGLQGLGAGNVVLNTSLGYVCDTPVTCVDEHRVRTEGAWWIQQVRTLGLEDRFLHLVAAGNIDPNVAANDAAYDWFATAAALLPDLVDADGNPLSPLTNTLVVENANPRGDFPYESALCLRFSSFVGGHISAIGGVVWSLTDASANADYMSGTSMAAPQVAGLAAYLLSIRPELTPQEVAAILVGTAEPVPFLVDPICSDAQTPAPIIDAYAALLALDRPAGLTSGALTDVPVRRALLDFDADGAFTENDLAVAALQYETSQGGLEFARSDLNNDARTGGVTTAPFDLDLDGSTSGSVSASVAGTPHAFDESALTDFAILCYYAYSGLYSGNPIARDQALAPYVTAGNCGQIMSVGVQFPTTVAPLTATPLTVSVRTQTGEPVAGAVIDFQVVGGALSSLLGTTAANGDYTVDATLNDAPNPIVITVTVRDGVSGDEIGQQTVQALAGATASFVIAPAAGAYVTATATGGTHYLSYLEPVFYYESAASGASIGGSLVTGPAGPASYSYLQVQGTSPMLSTSTNLLFAFSSSDAYPTQMTFTLTGGAYIEERNINDSTHYARIGCSGDSCAAYPAPSAGTVLLKPQPFNYELHGYSGAAEPSFSVEVEFTVPPPP